MSFKLHIMKIIYLKLCHECHDPGTLIPCLNWIIQENVGLITMKTEIHYVFTDYMGEIREMEIRRKYEASLNHSSCVSQILQSQLEKTQQLRTTLFNKLYAQSLWFSIAEQSSGPFSYFAKILIHMQYLYQNEWNNSFKKRIWLSQGSRLTCNE